MVDDRLNESPFDRFLRWLHALLAAIRRQVDKLVARVVLTVTPGTGI